MTHVVVLADTHIRRGSSRRLSDAVYDHLERADLILHAGDVLVDDVLDELAGFATVHAVLGNNDVELVGLLPETRLIDVEGVRIGMIHDSGPSTGRAGRMRRRFPDADLVVFGHSHIPWDTEGIDGQVLFNPGSPTERRSQPHRTLGTLDLADCRLVSRQIHRVQRRPRRTFGRKQPVTRRRRAPPDDVVGVNEQAGAAPDRGQDLLDLYDHALPQVYGYLLSRCGRIALAEDLTAETFLAAVHAAHRPDPPSLSTAWIVGVARHKLVDHWRGQARDDRRMRALVDETADAAPDPWDRRLDAALAHQTLERLGPHHRAALTLRYLDDLSVTDVAALLERSVHATEALLVRARKAFRRAYGEEAGDG